ncbi:hypothetical protein OEZ85_006098 [Tetradesmus obliquus]|uniref:PAS domain-containing protein n=1 Tax=Tetradesmus obliquus TaxID=3088 RepID=A0ABY8UFI8_TETOB|nr:hypothetical protein OEZ85_006098 [Tetradesmus obliquus]
MSVGMCDMNPMTRSWLSSSDAPTSLKITGLKMGMVVVATALDDFSSMQPPLVALLVLSVCFYQVVELPYYEAIVNVMWNGLWCGLLLVAALLVTLEANVNHTSDPVYADTLTWSVLYSIFLFVFIGALITWARLAFTQRITKQLRQAFQQRKAAMSVTSSADEPYSTDQAGVGAFGNSVVAQMGDLKAVYRWRDVRQISVVARGMRVWDEDGVPDPDAADFGEFVLKSGMARLPGDPSLLVMYANFLIVHSNGQAARTHMQMAQRAHPSLLGLYNIFVAQQLAKQLKRDGEGLDLLSHVEFQRNYSACVRAHKMALMSQRQFWASLLRDTIAFKDMQRSLQHMQSAEQRASAIYKRVLERYPDSGKLLKVYGRFLEFVQNDPEAARHYYSAATHHGTSDSMVKMVSSALAVAGGSAGSAAAAIDEKVDGLVIINAQGLMLLVNLAARSMFGYGKGEMEGKNISVLMPQASTSQQDAFMQRVVDGTHSHTGNTPMSLVMLHKDHSLFPICLSIARLSGCGSDALFVGVVRHTSQEPCSDGGSIVRFWTTPSGIILYADRNTADCFGVDANSLVGCPLGNLCTDPDVVNSFFSRLPAVLASGAQPLLQACINRTYLPPVDVELSLHASGAAAEQGDYRSLVVQARLLSEAGAVMVPYSQMHDAWFKEMHSRAPGASSCRSGAVVHLLSATGAQLPVTLKMTTLDSTDSGRQSHVVQVIPASKSAHADQLRLLLSVNYKGTILSVKPGASKALYGFDPSEAVGQPLAAVVDVFGLWRRQFAEDQSLLCLLASQAAADMSGAEAELEGSSGAGGSGGGCWRVGVHLPVTSDELIAKNAEQLAVESSRLGGKASAAASGVKGMLQKRSRLRPACMTLQLLHQDEEASQQLLQDDDAADETPIMQVALHRSDALSALLELDRHLSIAHADEAAGLMFGCEGQQLVRLPFARLVGMDASSAFDELLGLKATAAAKKGAMKAPSGKAAQFGHAAARSMHRMGVVKQVTAQHLVDGRPLLLEMQAMSYEQGGKPHHHSEGGSASEEEGEDDKEEEEEQDRRSLLASEDALAAVGHADLHHRVSQWVKHASAHAAAPADPAHPRQHPPTPRYIKPDKPSSDDEDEEPQQQQPQAGYMSMGRAASAISSATGKDNASAGQGAGGAADAGMLGVLPDGSEQEEDLAVDARRSKQLRRLGGLLSGKVAQAATHTWRDHSRLLLLVALVAHVACFAALSGQLHRRHQNMQDVSNISKLLTSTQQAVLRMRFMQKCYMPAYQKYWVCNKSKRTHYAQQLGDNMEETNVYHHALYLKGWKDARLQDYWTNKQLNDVKFVPRLGNSNATNVRINGTQTLWDMGNKVVAAGRELQFAADSVGVAMLNTTYFQYLLNNIPGSLFAGYAWSLDTFVDYTLADLASLSSIIIVMMVVEALVVQLGCMVHQAYLLQRCNMAHMRVFSVFLALPSATVRIMATQQMQVDEEDGADAGSEDDFELGDMAGAAAAGDAEDSGAGAGAAAGAASSKRQKSVRMDVAEDDEADLPKKAGSSSKSKAKKDASGSKAPLLGSRHKPPPTAWQAFSKAAHKRLLSWLHPVVKYNGKTLKPSNAVLARFMVPLMLWVTAVIVIFGVSAYKLHGMQGPLASLDTLVHVTYRVARVRAAATDLVFSSAANPLKRAAYRQALYERALELQSEHNTLLYGGRIMLEANVSFDGTAPASLFQNPEVSDLFFRSRKCLRLDQSKCVPPGDENYDITMGGLDSMLGKFTDMQMMLCLAPDSMINPDHPAYLFASKIVAGDVYDGLATAADVFVHWPIKRLEQVKQLHIILLAASLACMLLYFIALYRPYLAQLRHDDKAIVGLLSQLPAEVDVEGHVRAVLANGDAAADKDSKQ